jgi:hypothetical protein
MSNHKDASWHAAINAKLAEIAAATSSLSAWHEAWSHLGPDSAEQERLAVYRAVRDAGSVPEDAAMEDQRGRSSFLAFSVLCPGEDHALEKSCVPFVRSSAVEPVVPLSWNKPEPRYSLPSRPAEN